jgi:hypothetical protein
VITEWARVSPGRIVVATRDGAWVHTPSPGLPDAFDTPMTGRGSRATTRWLLDGAIAAACFGRAPEPRDVPLTPIRWAWRLAGFYRTTEATQRLLPRAAARFAASGSRALAAWARTRAREERGHDVLARRDLHGLGYDPDQVLDRFDPPGARALVRFFARAVEGADPIGCVGYSYALERLAAERDARAVAAVRAMLPPGVHATRCLAVHSGAGSDASHVADTIAVVAGLPAARRVAVATATYQTARLFYRRTAAPPPTDAALRERLRMPLPVSRRIDGQEEQQQDEESPRPQARRPRQGEAQ